MSKKKFKYIPIKTKYLRKNEDYITIIIDSLKEYSENNNLKDGDILVISEKFISTGEGRLIDEKDIKPSILGYFCYYWSKYLWGYILGPLLKTRPDRIKNLRKMPKMETIKHKDLVIKYVGLKYALKPASEGGVDLTNVPGTYASLLPENPTESCKKINHVVKSKLGGDIGVIIIDTDATYRFLNYYITALPYAIDGIIAGVGVLGYIVGKLANLLNIGGLVGPTPIGCYGKNLSNYTIEEILEISKFSDRLQSPNIKSIHDTLKKYNTFTITEEILEKVEHYPIVLVKVEDDENNQRK